MLNHITNAHYDCACVSELLPLYVNGRLEAEDVVKVVSHLMACEECRRELALLVRLKSDVKKEAGELPRETLASAFDLVRASAQRETEAEGEKNPRRSLLDLPKIVFPAPPQPLLDAKDDLMQTACIVRKTLNFSEKVLEKLLA